MYSIHHSPSYKKLLRTSRGNPSLIWAEVTKRYKACSKYLKVDTGNSKLYIPHYDITFQYCMHHCYGFTPSYANAHNGYVFLYMFCAFLLSSNKQSYRYNFFYMFCVLHLPSNKHRVIGKVFFAQGRNDKKRQDVNDNGDQNMVDEICTGRTVQVHGAIHNHHGDLENQIPIF